LGHDNLGRSFRTDQEEVIDGKSSLIGGQVKPYEDHRLNLQVLEHSTKYVHVFFFSFEDENDVFYSLMRSLMPFGDYRTNVVLGPVFAVWR